jgi:type VI secretion system protein ImpC
MFSLGADEQDARLLESLGLLAHDAGAPFVAGASSEIAGTSSIAFNPDPDDWSNEPTPGWARLRESKAAASLSLVIPRLLMRVPYGKHSEPCDRVAFEELEPDQPPRHEHYLWGSGSLAAALLLGNAFTESGWTLRPGHEVGGLPFHAYRVSGETIATPCAETLLTDRACERLLERGLTPLLTVRDSDTVILPRLQSIAEPLRPLAGRWTIG